MPRLAATPRHEMIAQWFFIVLGVGLTLLFWKIIQPFALVLLTAAVMAVIFTPFERRLRKMVRSPKLSSFLTLLLILIAVVGPLIVAGIVMADQAVELVKNASGENGWIYSFDPLTLPYVDALPESVREQIVTFDVRTALTTVVLWSSSHLGLLFSSSATFVFNVFIFFICLFYFLHDREKIIAEIVALSPFRDKTDHSILERMTNTIRAVVLGSLIVALVQGVVAGIGMTIFGVPGALIWAGLVIIAAQVPMVGTAAVLVPVCIYMFATGDTASAVGLTIWSAVAVGAIDNVLGPYLVEGKTRMHALLILLSILGGLQVFGPIGLIVGPTVLAAFLSLVTLYKAGVLEKSNL